MAKPSNRGLPSTFTINVPESVLRPPVDIGDYMDLESARVPTRTGPQPAASPVSRPKVEPPRAHNNILPISKPKPPPPRAEALDELAANQQYRPARRKSRKQLNLNPETLRMVEELLDYIQTYSIQKDAKASEMFHGLVTALYDARELMTLSNVPSRGKWGTPTAHAFPVALKNCFQAAIAEWLRRHGN